MNSLLFDKLLQILREEITLTITLHRRINKKIQIREEKNNRRIIKKQKFIYPFRLS